MYTLADVITSVNDIIEWGFGNVSLLCPEHRSYISFGVILMNYRIGVAHINITVKTTV